MEINSYQSGKYLCCAGKNLYYMCFIGKPRTEVGFYFNSPDERIYGLNTEEEVNFVKMIFPSLESKNLDIDFLSLKNKVNSPPVEADKDMIIFNLISDFDLGSYHPEYDNCCYVSELEGVSFYADGTNPTEYTWIE